VISEEELESKKIEVEVTGKELLLILRALGAWHTNVWLFDIRDPWISYDLEDIRRLHKLLFKHVPKRWIARFVDEEVEF